MGGQSHARSPDLHGTGGQHSVWAALVAMSYNKTAMKFAVSNDSSVYEQFFCSTQCCLIAFLLTVELANLEFGSLQALPLLYQLHLRNSILNPFNKIFTASSPGVDSVSRNQFLCLSIVIPRLPLKVLFCEIAAIQLCVQALLLGLL